MKQIFKRLLSHIIKVIGPFFADELEKAKLENQRKLLLSKQGINSVGVGVRINGPIFISTPKCVAIGNNVHIGGGCYWRTDGGLTIGDNTHISRNVTIYTTTHNYEGYCLPYDRIHLLRPVSIGKNVWIGMNVCIAPGSVIGDGAVIGLGAVVSGKIAEGAVVVGPKAEVVRYRNRDRYKTLVDHAMFGGIDGELIAKSVLASFRKKADQSKVFFIVSTGRSGTTTLSRILDSHTEIDCHHERWPQLIRLSWELAHGEKDEFRIRGELKSLYIDSMTFPNKIYGESDHCLFNMVSMLSQLLPKSKFIWLIRDGRKVVASTVGRGWFDLELERAARPNRFGTGDPWFFYRIQGDKCGSITKEEWDAMTRFQKNCWYWDYVNRTIMRQFNDLEEDRKFILRIEDLHNKLKDLLTFLSVKEEPLAIQRHNIAQHPKYTFEQWAEEEKIWFEKICGDLMNQFYPGWKAKNGENGRRSEIAA